MLAAVAQVPQAEIGVVVPHVGKQHRRARQVLEDLHRQRGIGIGLRGADDRGLRRAVGVIRIVEERLGDVGGGEVFGEFALALDAAEVVAELLDQVDRAVVHRELAPQQILGEAERGIGRGPVNLAEVCLEVVERRLDAAAAGEFLLGPAHEFVLVDVIDVDAELRHPLRGVDDRGVDAERASADQGIGQPAQTPGRGDGAYAARPAHRTRPGPRDRRTSW